MNRNRISRRSVCASLAAVTAFPAGLAQARKPRTLDLENPGEALTALIKMRGNLDAVDVPHWYYGTIYAVLPGRTPFPLVDFEGSEIDYYERQPDGSYHGYAATASFMRDTRSGKLIDTFDNPITGRRNEVRPNTISLDAHYIYSPNGYKRSDDPEPIDPRGNIADWLHWRESGDDVWLTTRRAYPPGVPMAEHQLLRGSLTELHDPDTRTVHTTAAPTFISPWLGWMDMRGHPGHVVWAGPAKKLDRVEQYPRELLTALMEQHFPEKLTAKPAIPTISPTRSSSPIARTNNAIDGGTWLNGSGVMTTPVRAQRSAIRPGKKGVAGRGQPPGSREALETKRLRSPTARTDARRHPSLPNELR